MLKVIFTIFLLFCTARAYFTLPGKCPENVQLQDDFRLADFLGVWHQVYHYSSDGRHGNNCSSLQLVTSSTGVHVNISRVDHKLFGRYSLADIRIPTNPEDSARMNLTFTYEDAPRRLMKRSYTFWVLANRDKFATIYTCQYSPLVDKHYIHIWVFSRTKRLNEVSLHLATRPIETQLGIKPESLTQDDLSEQKCTVKYFEQKHVTPTTFRYPVNL